VLAHLEVVVVTEGNAPPGLAYIAPYAATSIAEYFMEAGRDVLIVDDDLTHRARVSRTLAPAATPPRARSLPRRHLLYPFAAARTGDPSARGAR